MPTASTRARKRAAKTTTNDRGRTLILTVEREDDCGGWVDVWGGDYAARVTGREGKPKNGRERSWGASPWSRDDRFGTVSLRFRSLTAHTRRRTGGVLGSPRSFLGRRFWALSSAVGELLPLQSVRTNKGSLIKLPRFCDHSVTDDSIGPSRSLCGCLVALWLIFRSQFLLFFFFFSSAEFSSWKLGRQTDYKSDSSNNRHSSFFLSSFLRCASTRLSVSCFSRPFPFQFFHLYLPADSPFF